LSDISVARYQQHLLLCINNETVVTEMFYICIHGSTWFGSCEDTGILTELFCDVHNFPQVNVMIAHLNRSWPLELQILIYHNRHSWPFCHTWCLTIYVIVIVSLSNPITNLLHQQNCKLYGSHNILHVEVCSTQTFSMGGGGERVTLGIYVIYALF
jgi:hypothetical protein